MQPTQRDAEMREFLLFARRLAISFAKWVEARYGTEADDLETRTPAPKFEARTSTRDQRINH